MAFLQDKEVLWKAIPGFPNYIASNQGDIMKLPSIRQVGKNTGKGKTAGSHGYILAQRPTYTGHLQVTVVDENGRCALQYVHRLVALAFNKRRRGCDVVCHKDDNPANNKPENLLWGTHKINASMIKNRKVVLKRGKMKEMQKNVSELIINNMSSYSGTMRELYQEIADELDISYNYVISLWYGHNNPYKVNVFK